MEQAPKFYSVRPLKSVAAALLFCVVLGPIGVLYTSVLGGILMTVAALYLVRTKLFILLAVIWLFSCVWGVIAANRYNEKIIRQLSS
ncbi:MAG: hypothetical protein SFW66_03890 [Gammaproteobacteria bacterium]|nr:hypothetical protein [Gammaproteobacteria bacterium]